MGLTTAIIFVFFAASCIFSGNNECAEIVAIDVDCEQTATVVFRGGDVGTSGDAKRNAMIIDPAWIGNVEGGVGGDDFGSARVDIDHGQYESAIARSEHEHVIAIGGEHRLTVAVLFEKIRDGNAAVCLGCLAVQARRAGD